jgi:hypothetical protein
MPAVTVARPRGVPSTAVSVGVGFCASFDHLVVSDRHPAAMSFLPEPAVTNSVLIEVERRATER